MIMKITKITSGGQLSVPATIRRRWETSRVVLEDCGDHLIIRPAAADPIAALRGAFADPAKPSTDELRLRARSEDASSSARRSRG